MVGNGTYGQVYKVEYSHGALLSVFSVSVVCLLRAWKNLNAAANRGTDFTHIDALSRFHLNIVYVAVS